MGANIDWKTLYDLSVPWLFTSYGILHRIAVTCKLMDHDGGVSDTPTHTVVLCQMVEWVSKQLATSPAERFDIEQLKSVLWSHDGNTEEILKRGYRGSAVVLFLYRVSHGSWLLTAQIFEASYSITVRFYLWACSSYAEWVKRLETYCVLFWSECDTPWCAVLWLNDLDQYGPIEALTNSSTC